MSLLGVALGTHTFVVGVEDQEDGALRVYVGERRLGLYVLVEDEAPQAEVRRAWATADRLTMPKPPQDCLHSEAMEVAR